MAAFDANKNTSFSFADSNNQCIICKCGHNSFVSKKRNGRYNRPLRALHTTTQDKGGN